MAPLPWYVLHLAWNSAPPRSQYVGKKGKDILVLKTVSSFHKGRLRPVQKCTWQTRVGLSVRWAGSGDS